MVDFSGWELPVHYAEGIITEHLQVRHASGVFDVSHMGRFSIEGADAESFLDYALTNAAHTLTPGTAHYTLLATPHGGAIDDAYLYRRSASDFLLVVNAGDRDGLWCVPVNWGKGNRCCYGCFIGAVRSNGEDNI